MQDLGLEASQKALFVEVRKNALASPANRSGCFVSASEHATHSDLKGLTYKVQVFADIYRNYGFTMLEVCESISPLVIGFVEARLTPRAQEFPGALRMSAVFRALLMEHGDRLLLGTPSEPLDFQFLGDLYQYIEYGAFDLPNRWSNSGILSQRGESNTHFHLLSVNARYQAFHPWQVLDSTTDRRCKEPSLP